jgi:hypothetical protein
MGDLRTPIGLYFSIVGVIVLVLGLAHPDVHAALTEANVNLYSGLSMLAFGGVMLWLARRSF